MSGRAFLCAGSAFLLLGCSDLPTTSDGIVELRVAIPRDLSLAPGESATLSARAFDRKGVEVTAAITWATPDTTITVDEATGVVTGVTATGTGRVQASVGTLRSNLITFTLVAPTTPGSP